MTERAPWQTVSLDGKFYTTEQRVTRSHLAVFGDRVTIGDATRDTDPYVSGIVWGDFSGGLGTEDMNEGSDTARFRFGVAETRHLNHVTLAPETVPTRPADAPAGAICRPLGDVGGRMYVAFGAVPYGWNALLAVWAAASPTLGFAPVGKGVAFKGYLYVPLGVNGFRRLIETGPGTNVLATPGTGPAALTPIAFCRWDNKLFALDHDGTIHYTLTGGLTAGDWIAPIDPETGAALVLDTAHVPRALVSYFNRAGEPTLHVITDRAVWLYNHAVRQLTLTHVQFPPHPDTALGSAVWRAGEDLWITQGIGATRYTSASVIIPLSGLDRDDGLPAAYRGKIVDLEPEYNGLYALVHGDAQSATEGETSSDGVTYRDEGSYVPSGATYSALFCWTGLGWHALWTTEVPSLPPTWAMVSRVGGAYALWWGVGDGAVMMPLRRTFHSPRQGLEAGADRFAPTGFIDLPRFDAAMRGWTKIATHATLFADRASAVETLTVRYKTDRDPRGRDFPHLLGVVSAEGKHRFRFDPDEDGFAEGEPFEWIQFRIELARGLDVRTSPILDSFVLHFIKVPQDAISFRFTSVFTETNTGRDGWGTPDTLADLLDDDRLYRFLFKDRTYRVKVAQVAGADETGQGRTAVREVSLIQIGGPLDEEPE